MHKVTTILVEVKKGLGWAYWISMYSCEWEEH
jgi:hypothetical protein